MATVEQASAAYDRARARYRDARQAWFAHHHVCRACLEAWEIEHAASCAAGDTLLTTMDHRHGDQEDAERELIFARKVAR